MQFYNPFQVINALILFVQIRQILLYEQNA